MKTFTTASRLSLGLGSLALSLLCVLHSLGLMPDDTTALLHGESAVRGNGDLRIGRSGAR